MKQLRHLGIFVWSMAIALVLVVAKWLLHHFNFEPVASSSLQNSVVSSVIFVIGFIMSATIADYKESEKIPAEFAALAEDMYEDAKSLRRSYTNFDLDAMRASLIEILDSFREGTRNKRHDARREIHDLHDTFLEMEEAGVPPNFITKLKQQQAQLLRSLFRINYIQKIKFIPSAGRLACSIVVLVLIMLLLTDSNPFYGGLLLVGIIGFILSYMLLLIQVISLPFHPAGTTRDDVSLFLLKETRDYLERDQPKAL